LNEGRGTDTPFQVLGSPWLDAKKIIGAVKKEDRRGCRLEAITYTPRSIPGKSSSPIYRDEACNGIRIHLESDGEARPFRLAYSLLLAIHQTHKKQLAWKPFFDTLAGGDGLRNAIQSGMRTEDYVKSIEAELSRFDASRPRRYEQLKKPPLDVGG
jgi:uncharacterized protein YbbC (DUF1343 family)